MKYYCNPINVNYRYQFNQDPRNGGKIQIDREAADPSMICFKGTYYIFALDEDGNPINVSSFWTGNTNYMLCYNFGTDMNETNSVTVKSKSKQQVVLNYVVTIVPDGS